jgi:hypothetical protein
MRVTAPSKKTGLIAGAIAATLLIGSVGAGCGDGDGAATTATTGAEAAPTITKQQFALRADRICIKSEEGIGHALDRSGALGPGAVQPGAGSDVGRKVFLPAARKALKKLSALPVPAGSEGDVAAILDSARDGVSQLEKDPSIVTVKPTTAQTTVKVNFREASRSVKQLASEYGVGGCGALPTGTG